MKLKIDNTYICHYSKLRERKQYLRKHFSNIGLEKYEFVELFDKETWNLNEIQPQYPKIFGPTPRGTFLKKSEISLTLKYCWIINDAYKKKYKSILLFEDDVKLSDNFIELFNDFTSQLPLDWDIAWVGSCLDLHAKTEPNKNVYQMNGSRCTHAFMISDSCIHKIINHIKYADDCADFYFNQLIEKFNLKNYWFEPSLAYQNTIFTTSIHNET